MQTATNPETGETVVLVGQQWQKADHTATNDKGEKAYFVGGKWLTDVAAAPTTGERAGAAIAGANKGISNLLGLPMDTAENLVNLGIAGVGSVANAAGRPDLAPDLVRGTPLSSMWIEKYLNRAGIGTENPRPDDPASRMLHTGGRIAGGSMVPGAGVKSTLAAATGAAVAGEALGPEWEGVGALATAAGAQAARNVKEAVSARVAPNLATFKAAGTTPTVGQATENSFAEGLENLASKFPGGAGVMRRFTEGQQAAIGRQAKTGVSAEDAGRAIEQGVRGEKGFVQRFHAQQDVLYNKLDQYIPKETRIDVTRTRNALADLNSDIPGAPNLSKFFKNEKIQGIEGALKADTETAAGVLSQANPITKAVLDMVPPAQKTAIAAEFMDGKLPYEAVKKLRTLVGREITDSTIASSVPKSKWKALYGALSDDLGAAAKSHGPQAEHVWSTANRYTKSGIKRIEDTLDKVIGKGKQPEDIFKAFFPTDPDQANKVRATLRSLQPAERQVVSEAVVNRLGRATPGKQNEMGEIFSSETFLTNWNKLSDGAKAQLFPNHAMRQNVESIAKAAATIREGSKVFQNASGTAGSFAAYSVYASPIAAVATGSVAPLVAAGGAASSAYVGARMMTSPAVVEWLARPVNPSKPGEAVAHLARLATIYNNTKDEALKDELRKFVTSTGAK